MYTYTQEQMHNSKALYLPSLTNLHCSLAVCLFLQGFPCMWCIGTERQKPDLRLHGVLRCIWSVPANRAYTNSSRGSFKLLGTWGLLWSGLQKPWKPKTSQLKTSCGSPKPDFAWLSWNMKLKITEEFTCTLCSARLRPLLYIRKIHHTAC